MSVTSRFCLAAKRCLTVKSNPFTAVVNPCIVVFSIKFFVFLFLCYFAFLLFCCLHFFRRKRPQEQKCEKTVLHHYQNTPYPRYCHTDKSNGYHDFPAQVHQLICPKTR